MVCPKSSFPCSSSPNAAAAGSHIPIIPTVVLIANLPAVFPALRKSPCKILFERVNRERKLLITLPVPFLIGAGNVL